MKTNHGAWWMAARNKIMFFVYSKSKPFWKSSVETLFQIHCPIQSYPAIASIGHRGAVLGCNNKMVCVMIQDACYGYTFYWWQTVWDEMTVISFCLIHLSFLLPRQIYIFSRSKCCRKPRVPDMIATGSDKQNVSWTPWIFSVFKHQYDWLKIISPAARYFVCRFELRVSICHDRNPT
jgi:hypothetical protein